MSHRLITILLAAALALSAPAAHAQYYPQPAPPNQAPSISGRTTWSTTDSVFILYDGESAFDELSPDEIRRLERNMPPRERPARTARPVRDFSGWQLQSNLLYIVGVTPNAGGAWQTRSGYHIALNGAWAGWDIDRGDKRYKLWLLNPEVRRYFGQRQEWFAGVGGYIGQFNMKINDVGYQGDAMGGGIVAGRRIPLTDRFALDLSLGAGYVDLQYDSYTIREGYDMNHKPDQSRAWIGPTHAGVTLVWKINRY